MALPHGIATSVVSAAPSDVQITVLQRIDAQSMLLKGISIVYSDGSLAAVSIDAATVQT